MGHPPGRTGADGPWHESFHDGRWQLVLRQSGPMRMHQPAPRRSMNLVFRQPQRTLGNRWRHNHDVLLNPRRRCQPHPRAPRRRPDSALQSQARQRHRLGHRRRHRRPTEEDRHRLDLARKRRHRRSIRCLRHLEQLWPQPHPHLQRPESPQRTHHTRWRENDLHLRRQRQPRHRHYPRRSRASRLVPASLAGAGALPARRLARYFRVILSTVD